MLIGKFLVKDQGDKILFDNLNATDAKAKITGGKMFPSGAYTLIYVDPDLCSRSGRIIISFTNTEKTQLKFKFMQTSALLDSDCFYYNLPADQRPEPLPKEIILSKEY